MAMTRRICWQMHVTLSQAEKPEAGRYKFAMLRKRLRQNLIDYAENNLSETFSDLFQRTTEYNGTK